MNGVPKDPPKDSTAAAAGDPQAAAAGSAGENPGSAESQRAAPTDLPTLAVTPSTKKLKTLVPSCVVVTTRQKEACIPVSRRPRRAIWAASARGTTAFITAAESETRRRVSVETWLDGDIATGTSARARARASDMDRPRGVKRYCCPPSSQLGGRR